MVRPYSIYFPKNVKILHVLPMLKSVFITVFLFHFFFLIQFVSFIHRTVDSHTFYVDFKGFFQEAIGHYHLFVFSTSLTLNRNVM